MRPNSRDSDSIGPELSLTDVGLPPAVGDGFTQLYGTDERPETVAEWIADVRAVIERERGRAPTIDDLCATEDGDHAFVGAGETRTYSCVLDPLVDPFLTGETGTVRSTTPVRGATVEFDVGPDGEDVSHDGEDISHDDAVVSIGVLDEVVADEVSVSEVYRAVCPYVQTFEDAAEYETWAADVEAATTTVSAPESVAIARELADVLFDSEATPAECDGEATSLEGDGEAAVSETGETAGAATGSPGCDCC